MYSEQTYEQNCARWLNPTQEELLSWGDKTIKNGTTYREIKACVPGDVALNRYNAELQSDGITWKVFHMSEDEFLQKYRMHHMVSIGFRTVDIYRPADSPYWRR